MRKTMIAGIAATLLIAGAVGAQELDEILASNYDARGGLETIQNVSSARIKGTMSMGGQMEAPFTMEWKRPNSFRIEFEIQGQLGIQAYDGETAWQHMQFMGKSDAEVMPEEQSRDIEEQADIIDGRLIDSEAKGYTLELEGTEEIEGSEAFKIKVTKENGDVTYEYLDTEFFLTIKESTKRKVGETEQVIETTMGDYKEIEGLLLPHYIESKAAGAPTGQTISIDSVELNVEIADDRFVMPAPSTSAAADG